MIPTWFRMPCLYQMMTGLYCPGCGGTRAVRALLSGHPVLSFLYHPVVPYMAAVAVWAAASWILYFATGNRRFRPELDDRIAYAAAGIVILNFIIKKRTSGVRRDRCDRAAAGGVRIGRRPGAGTESGICSGSFLFHATILPQICPVLCDILHSLNTGRTQRNHKFLIEFIAET